MIVGQPCDVTWDNFIVSKKAASSAQQQDILQTGQEMSIEVKQHHLFRYPSEWDPRESGKTKGGYLEGKIQLPKVNFLKRKKDLKKNRVSGELSTADDHLHIPRIGST